MLPRLWQWRGGAVWAQTTGTIQHFGGGDFTFTPTATLNSNREWEVNYSVNLNAAIKALINNCEGDSTISDKSVCFADLPYFMNYGIWRNGQAGCLFSGATSFPRLTIKNGINGNIPFTSWSQTLRTAPDTEYCIAVYASNPESVAYNLPIARSWFKTPADPNPPAANPTGYFTGCLQPFFEGGYSACVSTRNACIQNGGTWDNDSLTCSGDGGS